MKNLLLQTAKTDPSNSLYSRQEDSTDPKIKAGKALDHPGNELQNNINAKHERCYPDGRSLGLIKDQVLLFVTRRTDYKRNGR